MSITIKGMEMPKNCRTCPMLFDGHFYRWCNITGESLGIEETDNGRDEHCPLIELPPHGRLIDADAVNKAMDERIEKLKDDKSIYEASCVATALDMFAPTVIEAEGET